MGVFAMVGGVAGRRKARPATIGRCPPAAVSTTPPSAIDGPWLMGRKNNSLPVRVADLPKTQSVWGRDRPGGAPIGGAKDAGDLARPPAADPDIDERADDGSDHCLPKGRARAVKAEQPRPPGP